uniref:Uncharacterized protein n=1 Tax=Rhipicephalus zambeziensis TaxID=60191 RepID=A0A224Y9G3_9ACAR
MSSPSSSSSSEDDDFSQAGVATLLDVANHFQFDPLGSSRCQPRSNTPADPGIFTLIVESVPEYQQSLQRWCTTSANGHDERTAESTTSTRKDAKPQARRKKSQVAQGHNQQPANHGGRIRQVAKRVPGARRPSARVARGRR